MTFSWISVSISFYWIYWVFWRTLIFFLCWENSAVFWVYCWIANSVELIACCESILMKKVKPWNWGGDTVKNLNELAYNELPTPWVYFVGWRRLTALFLLEDFGMTPCKGNAIFLMAILNIIHYLQTYMLRLILVCPRVSVIEWKLQEFANFYLQKSDCLWANGFWR